MATLLILRLLNATMPDRFPLAFSPKFCVTGEVKSKYHTATKSAVDFAVKTDKAFPSLYSRLELGFDWPSVLNSFLVRCRVAA